MIQRYRALLDSPEAVLEGLKLQTAEQVCKMMEKAELSRADLARVIRVSESHITQMLSGSRNFTLNSLASIAWKCGFTIQFQAVPKNDPKKHARRQG